MYVDCGVRLEITIHLMFLSFQSQFTEMTQIGKGGFGVVYRARDKRGYYVAIKKIPVCAPALLPPLSADNS